MHRVPKSPKIGAAQCDEAIKTMPTTAPLRLVGAFGNNVVLGSPFRLPRYFPYENCMIEVDIKIVNVVDHTSWNEIAKKATAVVDACVRGDFDHNAESEVAGYGARIVVSVYQNTPELETLVSFNKPLDPVQGRVVMGLPPLHPPSLVGGIL